MDYYTAERSCLGCVPAGDIMGDIKGFHGSEQDELPDDLLAGLMDPYQSSVFDLVQLRPTCMQTVSDAAPSLACCLQQLPSELFGKMCSQLNQ